MTRAIWKGDISFGLVSIPISLVAVGKKNELQFHMLNAKTKSPIRYLRIDEETGKEVPWRDIVKGYEYEKDNYIVVNEEAFEKASPDLFRTIDIEEFVNLKEIDTLYYTKPYYLIPEGKNKKAYVLLREALKRSNQVGVAKTILRSREYLSLIMPHEHTLLLYLIHFQDEIRQEADLDIPKGDLKTYKVSDKQLKMALDLIKNMSTKWNPKKYHNTYRETLHTWLEKQTEVLTQSKKRKKEKSIQKDVIDFISLLKASMKKKQGIVKKRRPKGSSE